MLFNQWYYSMADKALSLIKIALSYNECIPTWLLNKRLDASYTYIQIVLVCYIPAGKHYILLINNNMINLLFCACIIISYYLYIIVKISGKFIFIFWFSGAVN